MGRPTLNKQIRQKALREQLQAQGHVQHVVDIVEELGNKEKDVSDDMLDRYKVVLNTKLKLIGKYLPDLKGVELTGEVDVHQLTHEEWLKTLKDSD